MTGAASGIGQAAATLFVAEGARVALNDVAPLDDSIEAIAASDREASRHPADVSDPSAVEKMLSEVVDRWGRLDVVLANAGVTRDGFATDLTDEDWRVVMSVNLTGCFNVCRGALRRLAPKGAIVATSSVSALGNLGQANYAASKAGIEGLVRSLALEAASREIRVNAIAPGFTNTAMVRSIPAKVRDKLLSKVPLGRMASPEEIARSMVFLASDDASYITGQTLHVDGGASVGL